MYEDHLGVGVMEYKVALMIGGFISQSEKFSHSELHLYVGLATKIHLEGFSTLFGALGHDFF